jgi:diguanylate cyclase
VALCDIDNFKAVNDRHGHDTGDRVLRFVGRLLRDALPPHVFVARYGGEEFVCLFEGADVAKAAELLDAARVRLSERVLRDQTSDAPIGTVTFTAGVAMVAEDPAAALRSADEALYSAKKAGKDRVATSG